MLVRGARRPTSWIRAAAPLTWGLVEKNTRSTGPSHFPCARSLGVQLVRKRAIEARPRTSAGKIPLLDVHAQGRSLRAALSPPSAGMGGSDTRGVARVQVNFVATRMNVSAIYAARCGQRGEHCGGTRLGVPRSGAYTGPAPGKWQA